MEWGGDGLRRGERRREQGTASTRGGGAGEGTKGGARGRLNKLQCMSPLPTPMLPRPPAPTSHQPTNQPTNHNKQHRLRPALLHSATPLSSSPVLPRLQVFRGEIYNELFESLWAKFFANQVPNNLLNNNKALRGWPLALVGRGLGLPTAVLAGRGTGSEADYADMYPRLLDFLQGKVGRRSRSSSGSRAACTGCGSVPLACWAEWALRMGGEVCMG